MPAMPDSRLSAHGTPAAPAGPGRRHQRPPQSAAAASPDGAAATGHRRRAALPLRKARGVQQACVAGLVLVAVWPLHSHQANLHTRQGCSSPTAPRQPCHITTATGPCCHTPSPTRHIGIIQALKPLGPIPRLPPGALWVRRCRRLLLGGGLRRGPLGLRHGGRHLFQPRHHVAHAASGEGCGSLVATWHGTPGIAAAARVSTTWAAMASPPPGPIPQQSTTSRSLVQQGAQLLQPPFQPQNACRAGGEQGAADGERAWQAGRQAGVRRQASGAGGRPSLVAATASRPCFPTPSPLALSAHRAWRAQTRHSARAPRP